MSTPLLAVGLLLAQIEPMSEPLTLGVGLIVSANDGVPESFALAEYLLKNPILKNGAPVRVEIVDHPSRAQVVLTGVVEGATNYRYEPSEAASDWGVTMFTLGLFGAVSTLTLPIVPIMGDAFSGGDSRDSLAVVPVVGALSTLGLVLGAQTFLEVAVNEDANIYEFQHVAKLALRSGGRVVAEKTIEVKGERRTVEPLTHIRADAMEALWAETHRWLEESLPEASATPNERGAP